MSIQSFTCGRVNNIPSTWRAFIGLSWEYVIYVSNNAFHSILSFLRKTFEKERPLNLEISDRLYSSWQRVCCTYLSIELNSVALPWHFGATDGRAACHNERDFTPRAIVELGQKWCKCAKCRTVVESVLRV